MLQYFLRRLVLMAFSLFGVSVAIFLLLRIAPGNIADILFDSAGMVDPAEKKEMIRQLGLDLPLPAQYWHWISGLFRGDFGYSYVSEKPVLDEVLPRIPITARLAGLAMLFAVCTGVPFGVISAVRQNSAIDYALRVMSLMALSMPSFWLGLLVLMAFVNWAGILPIYDQSPPNFGAALLMYCVPAATVGFRSSALIMRLTRSSMLETLRQDYVRTARSKGLSNFAVTFVHALRNAVLPVITTIGIETAFLFGGLIVTETVFNIPGVARFLVEAIRWRDYPMVQNLVMFVAFVVVTVNLIVDMAYSFVDPRIRLRS
jgi:peptide/nickel transport system permease protein